VQQDNNAIFTGSGTLVNGSMKLIYPGLCDHNRTGETCPVTSGRGRSGSLGLAVPADPTDPLALNWSKLATNPVANNTGRDPSAAWQIPATGEWQFTTYTGDLFGTMDWVSTPKQSAVACDRPFPREICL